MADDLELALRSVEGEGPSPEFVANLRERVVGEMAKSAVAADDEFVIAIDLRSDEREQAMTKTRWVLVGAAAAAVALIVGFAALRGDGDEGGLDTVTTPEVSTTATVATTTAVPTTTREPATFAADATPLTRDFAPLEAGTYRVDTVGTPFSFTSEESLFVQPNGQAFFVLSHPSSQGPDDRDIVFMRLTALWDPADPNMQLDDLGDGWPTEDFAGWLDNLAVGVVASGREDTTLGGLAATRVDIEVDASACGEAPEFCVGFGTNRLVQSKVLSSGAKYRIWFIEQEDQAPLAVIVGINDESDSDWFDTADGILSSLIFGDVAPNPILQLSVGLAELPLLGGIRIELTADTTVTLDTRDFGRILLAGQPADAEFLTNPLDFDGNTLETSDDLVALLSESLIEVTEIESTTIGGVEARVFEIFGPRPSEAVLKRGPDDERGWYPPPVGQIWVLEHPERGLMMINAEAYGDEETTFPLILSQTEEILGTLNFIEID